jgi:hypothetical protein
MYSQVSASWFICYYANHMMNSTSDPNLGSGFGEQYSMNSIRSGVRGIAVELDASIDR